MRYIVYKIQIENKGYGVNFNCKLDYNLKVYPICFVFHFHFIKLYNKDDFVYICIIIKNVKFELNQSKKLNFKG